MIFINNFQELEQLFKKTILSNNNDNLLKG